MNRTRTLSVIVVFAMVLAIGAFSPALAAPNEKANDKAKVGKISICHWQEEEILLDENGDPVLDENGDPVIAEEAQWVVINVSKNAEKAHIGKHSPDGVTFDQEITEAFTIDDCLALNEA